MKLPCLNAWQINSKPQNSGADFGNNRPERRREIAKKANAKRHSPSLVATHSSEDHPLKIGDAELSCYVLEDGRRVLSLAGMVGALGMSLQEVATGIGHNTIPADHRARLLALGLVYNLLGSVRINTAGRARITVGF